MGCNLELFVKRIEGGFACVLDEKRAVFDSADDFKKSGFGKRCDISSISVRDGQIMLRLEKLPPANAMDDPWVKEYIKENGREPGFF
jgi:hypothetical protein